MFTPHLLMYPPPPRAPPPHLTPFFHPPATSAARSLLFAHSGPQGKVAELRNELLAGGQPDGGGGGKGKKGDKMLLGKKIALKKIVANMTMSNNDMVALFPDVVGVMGLQSLEIKKM